MVQYGLLGMAKGPALLSGRVLFPLAREVNTVGRRDLATGVIPDVDLEPLDRDQTVSRRHAAIEYDDGQMVIRDLGSTNGVSVGGQRLRADEVRVLADSDRVSFGGVGLIYIGLLEWPAGVVAEWVEAQRRGRPTVPLAETMTGQLRTAIASDQLLLHYQPKVTLATNRIDAVEALIRWPHPDLGMLGPDKFIPLAEETGLIRDLTRWVLDRAARQCREWADARHEISVSVNLSVQDLEQRDLADTAIDTVRSRGVQASKIELEVTETGVMVSPGTARESLDRLHEAGFTIGIDDFGIGNSSLAYLKSLPVDELKIDKSFCLRMDAADRTIVRSTVDLGHALGLRVVAEGVETAETETYLRDIGCDVGQGYYYARPGPPEGLSLDR